MDKKARLAKITDELDAILEKQDGINQRAKVEGRGLTLAEQQIWDALDGDFDRLGDERSELRKHFKLVEKNEARELERRRLVELAGGTYRAADYVGGTRPDVGGEQKTQYRSSKMKTELELRQYIPRSERRSEPYLYNPDGVELRDSFNKYLVHGPNALSPNEFRALSMSDGTKGGFLVPPVELVKEILTGLDDEVFIRQYCTLYTMEHAHSLGIPALDGDLGDLEWTGELGTGSEDSDLDLGRRDLNPHPLARRIKVSNKLLRSAVGNLSPDTLVRRRIEVKLGTVLESNYLNGNGVQRPLGVFVNSAQGVGSSRDVTSGLVAAVTADDLLNVTGRLKAQYRRRAMWVIHRDLELRIRKLKDANGDYLWTQGLSGNPNTLCGFPLRLSEYAPNTFSSGAYIAILGDFSFYNIVDTLDLQIQVLTELYSETNQTGYIARYEGDGMPVTSDAFARLKLL